MSDGPTTTPANGTPPSRPRPRPNYAARRMLVTTVAITAIVAIGVLAWSAVRGDDAGSSTADPSWNAIALVDRSTGGITLHGDGGDPAGSIAGSGRVSQAYVHGDRLALVGTTSIVLTDADDGATPTVIDIDPGTTVSPVETADSLHLLVGERAGGDLLIVDVDDGSVIDVAEVAAPTQPKLFAETVQVSADGTRFAVADAANFQTIVVQEDVDGAVFLADQPIAVGDELIATSQVVNLQADISLVTLDRRTEAVVPTELPRGAVMVDDELVVVSVDGAVLRIGKGDQEAERIGTVPVPAGSTVTWALPSYLGERLVVGGPDFEAVVDLDGDVLFSTTFSNPVDLPRPAPGWRCLPVGGGDTYHSIVAMASGEQLADLTGLTVTDVSADGCTVVGERSGTFELVGEDGSARLGVLRAVRVAPDGDAVVWTTTTGRTELVRISGDLELDDPIDLVGAPTNLLVEFVDR